MLNPQPIEASSAASMLVSLPEILPSVLVGEMNESSSARASSTDAQSATTSGVLFDERYHSGMQLNP